jgi:SEC-C motif-containing protein
MKSRYTAFTKGNIDYIEKTMQGPASVEFNFEETQKWANSVTWLGLEIIDPRATSHGSSAGSDVIAYVEFKAKFREKGKLQTLHELSEFHFIDGRWFYVDGKH